LCLRGAGGRAWAKKNVSFSAANVLGGPSPLPPTGFGRKQIFSARGTAFCRGEKNTSPFPPGVAGGDAEGVKKKTGGGSALRGGGKRHVLHGPGGAGPGRGQKKGGGGGGRDRFGGSFGLERPKLRFFFGVLKSPQRFFPISREGRVFVSRGGGKRGGRFCCVLPLGSSFGGADRGFWGGGGGVGGGARSFTRGGGPPRLFVPFGGGALHGFSSWDLFNEFLGFFGNGGGGGGGFPCTGPEGGGGVWGCGRCVFCYGLFFSSGDFFSAGSGPPPALSDAFLLTAGAEGWRGAWGDPGRSFLVAGSERNTPARATPGVGGGGLGGGIRGISEKKMAGGLLAGRALRG